MGKVHIEPVCSDHNPSTTPPLNIKYSISECVQVRQMDKLDLMAVQRSLPSWTVPAVVIWGHYECTMRIRQRPCLAALRSLRTYPVAAKGMQDTMRLDGAVGHVNLREITRRQGLDRLQQVVDLALDEGEQGRTLSCADIGADHGLLAIELHTNGVGVIASDRAENPLKVARGNFEMYQQHASFPFESSTEGNFFEEKEASKPEHTGPPPLILTSDQEQDGRQHVVPKYEREVVQLTGQKQARRRMLECRLGEGLTVLKEGEVDTVCIAGMGVNTIISILGAHKGEEAVERQDSSETVKIKRSRTGATPVAETWNLDDGQLSRSPPLLLRQLGVRRLVLQPMDARLEYVHKLRLWLRLQGWLITQETIISSSGKGGKRNFLTVRAEEAVSTEVPPQGCMTSSSREELSTISVSDWIGDFLPSRATDSEWVSTEGGMEEATIFLNYLHHQIKWLNVIKSTRASAGIETMNGMESRESTEERSQVGGGDSLVASIEAMARAIEGTIATSKAS
ncbi:unnamed protein product [Choristocarpus tenellus]